MGDLRTANISYHVRLPFAVASAGMSPASMPKGIPLTWFSKIPTLLLVDAHQYLSQGADGLTRPPTPIFAQIDLLLLTFPFATTTEHTAVFQSQ